MCVCVGDGASAQRQGSQGGLPPCPPAGKAPVWSPLSDFLWGQVLGFQKPVFIRSSTTISRALSVGLTPC